MKRKLLSWLLVACTVLTLFPATALAAGEGESGGGQVILVSVADLSALHRAYKEGDDELTGLSDMLALFAGDGNLTACDAENNEYALSVTWAYYGYEDADGAMHGDQTEADFVLEKGNTYYFKPILGEADAAQYCFGDITDFHAQVDYFVQAGTEPLHMGASLMGAGASAVTAGNDTYTDASPHSLSLNGSTYSLTLDLDPAGFTGTPRLVISIPKNISLSSYPTASNVTLAGYIQNVAVQTESDGSTTLTYTFNTGINALGFNITLLPTYKLKTGQTYTVTAAAYDGDTQKGMASDSITVTVNPTLANGAYYLPYTDTNDQNVDLKAAEYYYAKGTVRFSVNYPSHYDYDSLTVTVPIPGNATPGYYDGNAFVALSADAAHALANGTVTYKTNLTFTADTGTTYGTAGQGHGLVYELSASHALTATTNYQMYYLYNAAMGGIWFRFPGDTAAGTYSPNCSPRIVAQAGGDNYTLMEYIGYGGLSCYTASYTFRAYNINDYIYPYMSYGYVSVNTGSTLMPPADNQYCNAGLLNLAGEGICNVKVEYTGGYSGSDALPLSADLHCYKLAFNLASSGVNPSSADVTYSYYDASAGQTVSGGHAFLTVSDNILALDAGDYFTYVCATYDRLGMSSGTNNPINALYAYCFNANNLNSGTCCIYAKLLSATTSSGTYGAAVWTKAVSALFYPRTVLEITPWYFYLNGTQNGMDKGMQYSFYFSPSYSGAVKNMCVYFLLPDGYEFQSYAAPYNWGVTSSAYTITSRAITVSSETELSAGGNSCKVAAGTYTLYKIQYTDGAEHRASDPHYVYFSLGPTVDTAQVRTGLYIPSALCMTTESTVYPFSTANNYQLTDLLDFDGDGNTSERFARFSSMPTATQNAAKVITLSGSLTSSYESGSGTSKSYQYNSTGAYKFTIYNGLDSGNTATDATVNITVPSGGTGISARLNGAPELHGSFLSGAKVTYSTDGGSNYASSVADWSAVTNVRVVTASGISLASSGSAYISLPFAASYGASVNSASTALFAASMSYSLYKDGSLSSTPNSSVQNCTIRTAAVQVSGTVFKDYNSDGVRDANEQNNGKAYSVSLYAGTYTSGLTGLTLMGNLSTDYNTGALAFTNQIYAPGTFTLRVGLASTEIINEYSTGWVREGDYAYYTFTVGGSVAGVTAKLPVTAPRTLLLNYSSCFLYDNATKKLIATILPALGEGEAITFKSSDTGAVTVAADGTLTYVSEGTATITATVPSYGGGDNITATCTVYSRKSSYTIRLHAGLGVTLNYSGYTLSSGAYACSYTPGSSISLPTSANLTNGDATYYFEGWYDNESFTGSAVYSVSGTDYGNKEYYAKWTRYEVAYESAADTWAYGTLATALSYVYNGGTVKLLKNMTLYSCPAISKNITLKADGSARELNMYYYAVVSAGTLTVDDANLTITQSGYNCAFRVQGGGVLAIRAGTVSSALSPVIYNGGGMVYVSGGTVSGADSYGIENFTGSVYVSGGTVSSVNNYAIRNTSSGRVYLSGTPTVSGKAADVYEGLKGMVYGSDGAGTPTYYSGGELGIYCAWSPVSPGDVVVNGVSGSGHFAAANTGSYTAKLASGNFVITKYDYSGTEASAPTMSSRTNSSITLNAQSIAGQTVEYARSAENTAPSTGWQTSTAFTGLDDGTTYYFFARVREESYVLPGAVSSGTAIATKSTLNATASMGSYTYGGTVPTPSVSSNPGGGTVTYYYGTTNANSGGTQWTGITPTTLGVGTYYLYAVIAETDGYTGCATAAAQFTIGKADLVSSVNIAGYTYGGTVSVPSVTSNPGGGAVTYYYGTENANSGGTRWTGITPTTLDAGTYYLYAVIAASANYNSYTTAAQAFTVCPKSVPVVWSGEAASYVYNSADQGSSVTAKYMDVNGSDVALNVVFTCSGSAASFRNAGTYTATASMTAADGNYTLTGTTRTITMAKAPITVTANDNTIIYGDAAANAGCTIANGAGNTLFGEDTFTGTAKYAFGGYTAGSDVGSYTITVSGLANPNYDITFAHGTLTVAEASITDKTQAAQTAFYTGNPLTIGSAPTGEIVNGQPLTVRYSDDGGLTYGQAAAPAFTAAGNYTIYYRLSAPNHTTVTGTIAFTVAQNPANAIAGLSCGDITYGERPLPSITGAGFGASTVTYTYADSRDGTYGAWKTANAAGTWWVKAAIAGTQNYVKATAYASFTVQKAMVEPPVLPDRFYTGSIQTAEVAHSALYYVKSNAGVTEAGTYPVTLTLNDPANYKWKDTDGADLALTFRIRQAEANAIAGLSCGDITYGGRPLPSITGASFGASTVIYTYADSRDGTYGAWKTSSAAGTWWVKATIAGTQNYVKATAYASFTVQKAVVEPPVLPDRFYTGSMQTADVAHSALYYVKRNAGVVEAGAYPVTLTLNDLTNYKWKDTDGADLTLTFRIKRAETNTITGMFCADVANGGKPAPTITGASFGADTVRYTFSSARDGVFGAWSANSEPGTYWARATIAATDSYAEATSTVRFTYKPAEKTSTNTTGGENTAALPTGSIGASVANGTPGSLAVVVSIRRGSSEVAFQTLTVPAGTTGSVMFKDLTPGFYNTVVSMGSYMDTRMLEVMAGQESTASFTVLNLDRNTVVEVLGGAPDVAVDNLSGAFGSTAEEDDKGITQKDLESQEPIEIRLVAERIEFVEETEQTQLESMSGRSTIGLYVDLSLYKTVGANTMRLKGLNELLKVAIPIPEDMRGRESTIVVYRIHEGKPQTITTEPNDDGEYMEISGDYVILHLKNFSTYALGYRPAGFPWWVLLFLLIPVAGGLYWYKRKKDRKTAASTPA